MLDMFLAPVAAGLPRSELLARTVRKQEESQGLGRLSVTLFMSILWLMNWAINLAEITHSMVTVAIVREGIATAARRMNQEVGQPSWDTPGFVEMMIFKVTVMPFSIRRVLTKSVLRSPRGLETLQQRSPVLVIPFLRWMPVRILLFQTRRLLN